MEEPVCSSRRCFFPGVSVSEGLHVASAVQMLPTLGMFPVCLSVSVLGSEALLKLTSRSNKLLKADARRMCKTYDA